MALYGKIVNVEESSPAFCAGIRPGDELISIDGTPIVDVLDYAYHTTKETMSFRIRRGAVELDVQVSNYQDADIGLDFEDDLFDGPRLCANNCIFCFLKQMPPGMRQSLYVRDDDYRLSFAQGNYITLTNLTDDDMNRIVSQRMGPLYISVQTTDPELRVRMMHNRSAAKIMDQLSALASAEITMHTQIVLCPGINDGFYLEKSINDLAALYPWVESIAVVPVGITRYRSGLTELRQYSKEEAAEIIKMAGIWQQGFRKTHGSRLVYLSDEFYLRAGMKVPGRVAYEGFPQYENGVGICRYFLDELRTAERRLKNTRLPYNRYVLITGVLAEDNISKLSNVLNSTGMVEARTCAIVNKFLGETVTVAGLLTGTDIVGQLHHIASDEIVLIPDVALNGNRFLDDMMIEELQNRLDRRVIPISTSPIELIEQLREISY